MDQSTFAKYYNKFLIITTVSFYDFNYTLFSTFRGWEIAERAQEEEPLGERDLSSLLPEEVLSSLTLINQRAKLTQASFKNWPF